jgi:hypothetical protein
MSIVEQAQRGRIAERDFAAVIRESLPRAWAIIERLVERLGADGNSLASYGPGPMDDQTRGELLRMLAGTAIRRTTERHFGVQLLFQNCHNVAVVPAGEELSPDAIEFCSMESQVLNQRPELVAC